MGLKELSQQNRCWLVTAWGGRWISGQQRVHTWLMVFLMILRGHDVTRRTGNLRQVKVDDGHGHCWCRRGSAVWKVVERRLGTKETKTR